MRGSELPDPKCGPLENMSQACFANMDRIAKGYEPALKGVSRYNLEAARLVARRSQAWLEIPTRFSRCRSPQDLLGEQVRFWQIAAAQYTESWQRMAAALGDCAVAVPGLNGAVTEKAAAPAHDFIAVPEASQQAESGDRRAA